MDVDCRTRGWMYSRNRDGSKSTNLGMGVGWSWDGFAQGICKEINFVCLVKELAVDSVHRTYNRYCSSASQKYKYCKLK